MLFSGGKDSIVMAPLAQRASWPGRSPFPLLHVDTGHNFPETLAYRDELSPDWTAACWWPPCKTPSPTGACRRQFARSLLPPGRFVEVYVQCDLAEVQRPTRRGCMPRPHAARCAVSPGSTSSMRRRSVRR
jgi:hypothetical protein